MCSERWHSVFGVSGFSSIYWGHYLLNLVKHLFISGKQVHRRNIQAEVEYRGHVAKVMFIYISVTTFAGDLPSTKKQSCCCCKYYYYYLRIFFMFIIIIIILLLLLLLFPF